jgi:hypothetical protein
VAGRDVGLVFAANASEELVHVMDDSFGLRHTVSP